MSEIITQIEGHMRALNLRAMIEVYRELGERATKGKLQYEEYLAILLEEEVSRKTEGSIKAKIAKAKFPFQKTIEEFDFSFQPSLKDREVIKLCSLDFIEQKGNLIFLGPPGVGKTHLSIAIGIKACIGKYRVVFHTAQRLIEELMLSQRDGSLIKREQANLLFQLISMRYEKGSIILTSNYNFDEWGRIFEDNVVASAIIDRIVHHANIFYINGSSYRLKDKLKRAN